MSYWWFLAFKPNNVGVYFNMGNVFWELGKLELVVVCYKQVVKLVF